MTGAWSEPDQPRGVPWAGHGALARPEPANLADVLERVLDKGIVIAGDIRVNLVDVELLTIRVRLLIASVDRAREMGIDWWEHDPMLSSRAHRDAQRLRGRTQEEAREVGGGAPGGEDRSGEHVEDREEGRAGEPGARERGGEDDT